MPTIKLNPGIKEVLPYQDDFEDDPDFVPPSTKFVGPRFYLNFNPTKCPYCNDTGVIAVTQNKTFYCHCVDDDVELIAVLSEN